MQTWFHGLPQLFSPSKQCRFFSFLSYVVPKMSQLYLATWPCKLNCPNLFNPWFHWEHTSSTRFPSSSAQSSAQYPASWPRLTAAAPEKVREIPGIVQTCFSHCIYSKWSDIGNCNIGSINNMWCRIVFINSTVHRSRVSKLFAKNAWPLQISVCVWTGPPWLAHLHKPWSLWNPVPWAFPWYHKEQPLIEIPSWPTNVSKLLSLTRPFFWLMTHALIDDPLGWMVEHVLSLRPYTLILFDLFDGICWSPRLVWCHSPFLKVTIYMGWHLNVTSTSAQLLLLVPSPDSFTAVEFCLSHLHGTWCSWAVCSASFLTYNWNPQSIQECFLYLQ